MSTLNSANLNLSVVFTVVHWLAKPLMTQNTTDQSQNKTPSLLTRDFRIQPADPTVLPEEFGGLTILININKYIVCFVIRTGMLIFILILATSPPFLASGCLHVFAAVVCNLLGIIHSTLAVCSHSVSYNCGIFRIS